MHSIAAAVLLTAALAAQGAHFVVDATPGHRADFTDLAAAIANVPAGSTLLVRAGAYAAVDIAGKSLTVLCDDHVTAGRADDDTPFLCVRGTAPNQTVLVRGLRPGSRTGIAVIDAAGPVTIDGAGLAVQLPPDAGPAIRVMDSRQVALRQLTAVGHGAAEITDSVVVFEQCVLRGGAAIGADRGHTFAGAPAIWANNSNVQLVHSPAFGGHGLASGDVALAGSAAVVLAASNLRALGSLLHPIAGGTDPTRGQLAAVAGIGIARINPAIPLANTAANEPGVLLTRPHLPALVSTPGVPGGVLDVVRHGSPHTLCAIAISLRGPHQPLPALSDPLWVRDTTTCVESLGRAGADGIHRVQKAVPNDPALRGYQVVWQAADLGPNGVVAVSNPSPTCVR